MNKEFKYNPVTTDVPNSAQLPDTGSSKQDELIRSKLVLDQRWKQLYEVTQNPVLFNIFMAADRCDQGWFDYPIQCISVFRATTTNWIAVLQEPTNSTLYKSVLHRRICFFVLLLILLIPAPYAKYVSMVPNLLAGSSSASGSMNSLFLEFMTAINIIPLICWLAHLYVVHRKNQITELRLNLFRQSIAHNRVNSPKCDTQQMTTMIQIQNDDCQSLFHSNLTASEQNMLIGISEELKSAVDTIPLTKLQEQQVAFQCKWRKCMFLLVLWVSVLFILYCIWDTIFVFSSTTNSQYAGVFMIFLTMLITAPIRFSVPIVIMFKFYMECELLQQKFELFVQSHQCRVDVVEKCHLLQYINRSLGRMAANWQYVFLTMFALPLLCMLLVLAATFKDSTIIQNEWFFLVYCIHYSLMALIAFKKAAAISATSQGIASRLRTKRLCKEVVFDNEEWQIKDYFWYIQNGCGSFSVFGLTITEDLFSKLQVVLFAIITWLSDNVVKF